MRSTRWTLAVLVLLTSAACVSKSVPPRGTLPPAALPNGGPPSSVAAATTSATGSGSGGQSRLSRKRVTGKEEPATLIATDRTQCIVPAERYRETAVGADVWCDWQTGIKVP